MIPHLLHQPQYPEEEWSSDQHPESGLLNKVAKEHTRRHFIESESLLNDEGSVVTQRDLY